MMEVTVYRGTRQEGMYLYVRSTQALEDVPEELLTQFGTPSEVVTFELTSERALARADAPAVMEAIEARGFYLQMPPSQADLEAELAAQLLKDRDRD